MIYITDNAIDVLAKSIIDTANKVTKKAEYDCTREGVITAVSTASSHIYSVKAYGNTYKAYSTTAHTFSVGDSVIVLFPRDKSDKVYITGLADSNVTNSTINYQSYTVATGVTYQAGGIYRIENMLVFSLLLSVTSAFSAGDTLLTLNDTAAFQSYFQIQENGSVWLGKINQGSAIITTENNLTTGNILIMGNVFI